MTKILTIIGTRPQFIKASPVSSALKKTEIDEIIVDTGQHYDSNMSDIFINELNIPKPNLLLLFYNNLQTTNFLTSQTLYDEMYQLLLLQGHYVYQIPLNIFECYRFFHKEIN